LQIFTRYFSRPITWVFNGSAEFNITLRALGQSFTLYFYSREITGKAKFGGKRVSDSLQLFSLFKNPPLRNGICPNHKRKFNLRPFDGILEKNHP